MDAPCKIQGNIHVLLCLNHKINVSRILGTYHFESHRSFIYLDNLNELFRETIRLNTGAPSLESWQSAQKNPLRTN